MLGRREIQRAKKETENQLLMSIQFMGAFLILNFTQLSGFKGGITHE
jgi:hypothetical protein